jgi:hypothetical protein
VDFIIDGTERRIQRPHDTIEQKEALALRRDTLVSVEYSEELNFTTSSATYQRTNRHGILGQKPSDFQRFL